MLPTQQSASAQLKDNGVSRSSTRQFVVHGDDSVARGVVCVFSERIKSDLLRLFNYLIGGISRGDS